jgi:hypothetical protein
MNEICYEGLKLRHALMEEYKDKYLSKWKILINSPSNGMWKYTFQSWEQVLEYMGVRTDIVYDALDIPDEDGTPGEYDIYISIADRQWMEVKPSVSCKIGIASKQESLGLIKEFGYNFLISSFSDDYVGFKWWVDNGIEIKSIPFGFNPLIYYPEEREKEYDYFFVGTNSPYKDLETKKYLLPIVDSYAGILRGVGWGTTTLELDPIYASYYYNTAKINLNYHMQLQKDFENEINERTFIISACGGFQLVDNPKILPKFYSLMDMAVAQDEKDYMDKFRYYLDKPKERHEMAYNALVTSYKNNYSLFSRLEDVIEKCISGGYIL